MDFGAIFPTSESWDNPHLDHVCLTGHKTPMLPASFLPLFKPKAHKPDQYDVTHCDDHLQVKSIGQKGLLCDTPQLPVPPGQMKKRCWRGPKDRGVRSYIMFWNIIRWGFFFFFFFEWDNLRYPSLASLTYRVHCLSSAIEWNGVSLSGEFLSFYFMRMGVLPACVS